MREIKFRAWDGYSVKLLDGYASIDNGVIDMDDIIVIELMQYTVLKDKNGVEIYEGDIVKQSDDLGREVVIYKGCWMLKNHYALYNYDKGNIEVIGNIYENPELLQ